MEDLTQMIEKINEAVNRTLSLACYGRTWEAHSYKEGSLFEYSAEKDIQANSFTELIEKAYKIVKEKERSNGAK